MHLLHAGTGTRLWRNMSSQIKMICFDAPPLLSGVPACQYCATYTLCASMSLVLGVLGQWHLCSPWLMCGLFSFMEATSFLGFQAKFLGNAQGSLAVRQEGCLYCALMIF